MSVTLSSTKSQQAKRDQLSMAAVGMVAILSLLLGVILKSSVENRSQHIERKGITASVPANWTIQEGAGDLVFVSWDPFTPGIRYAVSLVPLRGGQTLGEIPSQRNQALSSALEAFRVLEETPIIRKGRDGYKTTYAFVDASQPGLPLVLRGTDYYFLAGENVMVVSLQAQAQDYEEAQLRFEVFLDSVSYK
ncbi:MAG: hypothetical protein AB1509_05265 [Chloroflexota bacterium]